MINEWRPSKSTLSRETILKLADLFSLWRVDHLQHWEASADFPQQAFLRKSYEMKKDNTLSTEKLLHEQWQEMWGIKF